MSCKKGHFSYLSLEFRDVIVRTFHLNECFEFLPFSMTLLLHVPNLDRDKKNKNILENSH
jgi:hypothetical protein